MAEALVSAVLDRLFSHGQQYKLVSQVLQVRDEIEDLTKTFQMFRLVIANAEKRQMKEELVRNWLGTVTDIAYQLDDAFDEWAAVLPPSQMERVGSSRKVSPSQLPRSKNFGSEIVDKIKDIKGKAENIENLIKMFGFLTKNTEQPERLKTISGFDASYLVGRDDEIDAILHRVCRDRDENFGLKTISILGFGGTGKTALAQLVFNRNEVKNHFDRTIWVCVSHPFVPKVIFAAILEAIQGRSPDLQEPEALQQQLREVLCQKRFLLVLDDVWNEDYASWEQLETCLKNGGVGSSILVTTRNGNVAKMIRSTYVHRLDSLPREQCRELFFQVAFLGRDGKDIAKLQQIGETIADKCDGLPVTIKSLGTLMQPKDTKEAWGNVLNSDMWEDVCVKKLSPTLLLSYYDLQPALKRCFLYCAAIFPKGHVIVIDKLIKLWMAQGYLNSKVDGEMEGLGRYYFEELASQSFFQDFENDQEGNIVNCKMHGIVHDFAQILTRDECLILDVPCENLNMYLRLHKARHATLRVCGVMEFSLPINGESNSRTLLVMGNSTSPINQLPISLQNFKCLRALDLSGNQSIVELPSEVVHCIHLRYLNLFMCTSLETLPERIGELCNMQTLNLEGCENLIKLPQGITSLINLRHLIIDVDWARQHANLSSLPKGVGKLTSLRTLSSFIVCDGAAGDGVCKIEELRNLKELREELQLYGLGWLDDAEEVKKAELKNKKHLNGLRLDFRPSERERIRMMKEVAEALQPHPDLKSLGIFVYMADEWPAWMMDSSSLSQLTRLELSTCGSEYLILPPLGDLPHLERLDVHDMMRLNSVGDELLGSSAVAFPKLKHLSFQRMPEWESWECTEEGGKAIMPCLCSLKLAWNQRLQALPEVLMRQPGLDLTIYHCPFLGRAM